jgi:sulfate permease, SulP family
VALACFVLARSFAKKYGYEITALGAANIATGMAHGFVVAGGMSQTAVNDMGGATSPVALVVTSGAIALTLLFFAAFFHNLPEPILGAIVLMATSRLVRLQELRRLVRALKDRVRVKIAELRDEVVEDLKIIGADQDLGSIVAHRTIDDCLAASKD